MVSGTVPGHREWRACQAGNGIPAGCCQGSQQGRAIELVGECMSHRHRRPTQYTILTDDRHGAGKTLAQVFAAWGNRAGGPVRAQTLFTFAVPPWTVSVRAWPSGLPPGLARK
jgi:hypothetical protein